jgi:hypothetical protein
MGAEGQDRGDRGAYEVPQVEEDEEDKVLVVFVSDAVVHEGAVVVKSFHTKLAVVAVEGSP